MNEPDESILEIIFQAREDELAQLEKRDKEFLNSDDVNKKKKYYDLKNQLDKIPYNLNKIKEEISKSIEDYIETVECENSYFTEKYYLKGLKDGMKLMSEVIK